MVEAQQVPLNTPGPSPGAVKKNRRKRSAKAKTTKKDW